MHSACVRRSNKASMNIEDKVRQLHADDMNDEYIARLLCIDVAAVRAALSDPRYKYPEPAPRPKYPPKKLTRRQWQRQHVKNLVADRVKRDAAVRKQVLADIPERHKAMVGLVLDGLSARKIQERLKIPHTDKWVSNLMRNYLGPVERTTNSYDNQIHPNMRPYIHSCLEQRGKDRYTCERCGDHQTESCEIHHTKYEGATIYDLQYVCRSCNLARAGQGIS